MKAGLLLIAALVVVCGCKEQGPSPRFAGRIQRLNSYPDNSFDLKFMLQDKENEVKELREKLDEIKEKTDDVRDATDELKQAMSHFSDGYSNWRDVVGDVEKEFNDLDSAVFELDLEIQY